MSIRKAALPQNEWQLSKMTGAELSEATTISIIDDDALARDGIRELVESLGYEAVTFVSAEHFLESEVVAKTACLITDIQMPGLSGLELQEALQAQGYRTPVILITAYPSEQQRNRALSAGAIGFLSKPFEEHSLVECLTLAMDCGHDRRATSIERDALTRRSR
jgi:FixJ family two-component response regulator